MLLWALVLCSPLPPDEDPAIRVEALMNEEDQLAARLDALDRQIIGVTREQNAQAERLDAAQETLTRLDQQLEVLHLRARTQRARLVRRLRAQKHLESTAWVQVLLSASDPAELIRRRYYLERILGADVALLSRMKADRALLALTKAERIRAVELVRDASTAMDQRRARLEADRAVRTELMRRLRGERRLMRRLMAGRQADRARVNRLLPQAGTKSGVEGFFAEEYGRLPHPAPGRLVGRFGQRVGPGGTKTVEQGIAIAAPAGAPVRAVYSGRVEYADWYPGFGNLMILDHGDGYHTLYAHLAELHQDKGAVLAQGEALGVVGDTGSLQGPRLYFEVRVDGEPEDPRRWLR